MLARERSWGVGGRFLFGLAVLGFSLTAGSQPAAEGAEPAQRYVVRYLSFTASSVPGVKVAPDRRIHELRGQAHVSAALMAPLTADPTAYLQRLQKLAPEFQFTAGLSGIARFKEGEYVIEADPRTKDEFGIRLRDRLQVRPDPDLSTQVRVLRTGEAEWKPYRFEVGREIGGGKKEWSGNATWFVDRSQTIPLTFMEYGKNGEPPRLVIHYLAVFVENAALSAIP